MQTSKKEKLKSAKNIAILGCSNDNYRTSYHIAQYLQENGYRIIPINPNYETILGEKVYADLQQVPDDIQIDIADIFRNKKHSAEMVDQIVERSETSASPITVWTQLDVSSDEAKSKAENANLDYVENECIMVEHQRLFGD